MSATTCRAFLPCAFVLSVLLGSCRAEMPDPAAQEIPSQSKESPAAESPPVQESLSWEDAILRGLAEKVTLHFDQTPLSDVADHLAETLDIPIVIDESRLDDVGLLPDEQMTLHISGVSARAALTTMLRDLDLTWTLRHEVVLITTPEEEYNTLQTRVYDVADLLILDDVTPADGDVLPADDGWYATPSTCDFDLLISVITECIEPRDWLEAGGDGTVHEIDIAGVGALAISQTWRVHAQVEALLASLRHCRDMGQPPLETDCEKPIRKALARPVTLEFVDTPLEEVLEYLRAVTHVPITLDVEALDDVGLSDGELTRIRVSDVTLQSALTLMLRSLDLTWLVRDEQLLITTPEEAECNLLSTKVYDVSDLPAYRDEQGRGVPGFNSLISLMIETIQPRSWLEAGGSGTICEYQSVGIQALVISQTWHCHDEIAELLGRFRELRGEPLDEQALSQLPRVSQKQSMAAMFAHLMTPDGQVANSGPVYPGGRTVDTDPKRDTLVEGTNRFAFDLYGKLHQRTEGNLLFSPPSISTCMAMVYAGARGDTAKEINRGMRFSLPQEDLHSAFASLLKSLPSEASGGCELRMANRLWAQQGMTLVPDFVTITREQYGAELCPIDFADRSMVVETINAWVEEQTARKIKELLSTGDLKGDSTLVAVNAVYFNGQWADKFEPKMTITVPFYGQEKTVDVRMMVQLETCGYAAHEDFQILEKTYGDGSLSMILVLPKKGPDAMAALEKSLSEEALQGWLARLRPQQVDVFLPRFDFASEFRLADILHQLGIELVFSPVPGVADLSGISSYLPLFLDEVIHKATIEVDERGTEATAATAITGGIGGMGPMPVIPVFRADRPFVFLIRDNRTGSILFLGRLSQPAAEGG